MSEGKKRIKKIIGIAGAVLGTVFVCLKIVAQRK